MARGFNYAPGASDEVELARTPGLRREQIQALVASRNAVVREVAASRQDLVLAQMVVLADDRTADVRAALAANRTAHPSVLEQLAEDRHPTVLSSLLTNPALPAALIDRLAAHRRTGVRVAAARRLGTGSPGVPGGQAALPGSWG